MDALHGLADRRFVLDGEIVVVRPDGLVFAPSDVLERVDRLGNVFAPVLERVQRLPT